MADKKVNKKTKSKKEDITPIVLDIDYDKLAAAIVKAEHKAKVEEKKKKEEPINSDNQKSGFKNSFKCFWRLMTFKKSNVNDDSITFTLLKSTIEMIILVAESALVLFGIVGIVSPFIVCFSRIEASIFSVITIFIFGLVMVIFSRLLRVSRLEIDRLNDRDYLNTIICSFLGIIGTIVAVIEFIRSFR